MPTIARLRADLRRQRDADNHRHQAHDRQDASIPGTEEEIERHNDHGADHQGLSYGCGLKLLVFENLTESTLTEIQDVIDRAILFFEPRILVDSIEVDIENVYQGIMTIEINYTIRITNSRDNMVYPFYFQEGTGPVV